MSDEAAERSSYTPRTEEALDLIQEQLDSAPEERSTVSNARPGANSPASEKRFAKTEDVVAPVEDDE